MKSLASVVRRQLPWLETSDHATLRAWCEHEIIGSAVFMKLMDDRVGWYLMAPFHFPQTGEIITPVAPEHLSQWTTVKTFPKGEKGCDGYKKVAPQNHLCVGRATTPSGSRATTRASKKNSAPRLRLHLT